MVAVSGGPVAVDISGDGYPVVMIHGLGGTSNTFQPLMPALRNFRVIRPDLPGSGRSPVPFDQPSIEGFALTIARTVRGLGVERAHLVGHSLGTIVCQAIAVAEPALVRSLTLFGALTEPPQQARDGLIARAKAARSDGMAAIADQIVANTLSTQTHETRPEAVAFVRESVMRQNPEGYARTCEALSKAKAADATRIAVPALLVTGDADPVAPVSMAQALADKLKGAALSVLDRCGHWTTMERAEDCRLKLADFLRANTG